MCQIWWTGKHLRKGAVRGAGLKREMSEGNSSGTVARPELKMGTTTEGEIPGGPCGRGRLTLPGSLC
jgi:hypothetical protein